MGHGKLRKFKENEGFSCLIQPSAEDVLDRTEAGVEGSAPSGGLHLKDYPTKGRWNADIFHSDKPITLELGCGRGEYTVALAERMSSANYIGVDIKGARLWKGAKYVTENNIPNVAFLRTRIEFIEAFFAPGEVSEIWLTFSDPQPKSENSRLSSPVFLERYSKFLALGGIINLKTDSQLLYHYSLEVARSNRLPILASTDDLYGEGRDLVKKSDFALRCGQVAADALFGVQTYYEKMFLSEGLPITFLSFSLDHPGPYVSPEWDEEYWRGVDGGRRTFSHRSR